MTLYSYIILTSRDDSIFVNHALNYYMGFCLSKILFLMRVMYQTSCDAHASRHVAGSG